MPKADLVIDPPVLNTAGFLGFTPDRNKAVLFKHLGAFITNPISLEPRHPARTAACLPFTGGFLLHNGYPNPGLKRTVRKWAKTWASSSLPVLVSLLPQEISEIPTMMASLEGLPGVMGVEINLPPGASGKQLFESIHAAFGELAVVLRLSPEQALHLVSGDTEGALEAGLAAISLGAPRGALINASGKIVYGRLYGPAIFPQTLAITTRLTTSGIPVIAGGGVYSAEQADQLVASGALAVLLDAVLWRDPGLSTWG